MFGRISREAKVNQIVKSIKAVNMCFPKLTSVAKVILRILQLCVVFSLEFCNFSFENLIINSLTKDKISDSLLCLLNSCILVSGIASTFNF